MIVQVCEEYVQVYKCLLFCEVVCMGGGAGICMLVCKDIVEDMHFSSPRELNVF